MEHDEFYDLTASGAQVLGSPSDAQQKTGFLRRLFG